MIGIIEFGALVVVAGVVGVIGQFITGYSRGGLTVSVIMAFIGAWAGPYFADYIDWAEPITVPLGDVRFPLVTSAAGALVLVLIVNLLTKKRKF
jgi:uncharacterized membrane protein YeaQ/YmgE (transglycosylase-associated protein family)